MTVNIHAAKTHLSRLISRAERGERITIARAGKPVAQLGPALKKRNSRSFSDDDPLLRVEEYRFEGPVGKMTSPEIDRIIYGG